MACWALRAARAVDAACSPTASALALDAFPDNGLFLRTMPSDSLQASAIARLVDDSGNSTAVVVYLDDPYGRPFAEEVRVALRAEGTGVTDFIGFTASEDSLAATVEQVVEAQPGMVVVIADDTTGPAVITAIDAAATVAQNEKVLRNMPSILSKRRLRAPEKMDRSVRKTHLITLPTLA